MQHYLTDALGSTLRLTNNSAAKIVDYTYEPYGKATADTSSTNTFQYTGRENDGTGLNYYRARYQHPVLGQFISEDPIGLAGGANLYAYVQGRPTYARDPEGTILINLGFAVLGGLLDAGFQIAEGMNEGQSFTDAARNINVTEVAISAAASAIGFGPVSAVSNIAKSANIFRKSIEVMTRIERRQVGEIIQGAQATAMIIWMKPYIAPWRPFCR